MRLLPALAGLAVLRGLYLIAVDRELWIYTARWLTAPQWPVFGDLDVSLLHFRQAAAGIDPLVDPKSEFAYPRFFLQLRQLHLQDLPSPAAGFALGAAWVSALIWSVRPRTAAQALVLALGLFSPPIVFCLERANPDLLIGTLLILLGAGWARGRSDLASALAAIACAVIGLLKIYPCFVFAGGVWAERGRRRAAWIAVGLVTALWWFLIRDELTFVFSKFPLGQKYSWGSIVLFENFLGRGTGTQLIALGTYGAALAVAWVAARRWRAGFFTGDLTRREWGAFWIGTAVCCGAFLTTNYAYRWIFILPTLPLLWRLAGSDAGTGRIWARVQLALIAVTLAAPVDLAGPAWTAAQLGHWACVWSLAAGAFALAPRLATEAPREPALH
jgi:hypothetical protein